MEVMLTYSAKPICFVTYEWEGTAEIIEMAEVAMGGAEYLRINPSVTCYLNPTSSFVHNEAALRKLFYLCRKKAALRILARSTTWDDWPDNP